MNENSREDQSQETFPAVAGHDRQTPRARSVAGLTRMWFGFQTHVDRRTYAATGSGLMVVKYAVELAVLWWFNRAVLSPLEFASPVLSNRQHLIAGADWLGWAWFIWTLPFLWIAVTMSVRRSMTAGLSAWVGMLIFIPGVNLFTMLGLALLPDKQPWSTLPHASVPTGGLTNLRSAAFGVALGLAIAGVMLAVSVYALDTYGAALFLGTPVVMGAVAAVVANAAAPRSWSASVGLGLLAVILAGAGLFALALEGAICIAMAAPITLPQGALGGVVGKVIADSARPPLPGTMAALMVLPGWAGAERLAAPQPEFMVTSSVVIQASPTEVWQHVIHFPDLEEPDEWYFRYGIACPMRAEIHGEGVGAERHCIFTTGTFVEPITVWDAPRRLAFDVAEQPAPMFEMSPYEHVHPPHLEGALRSTRGVFLLEELPDGQTLLIGNTWYEFDMYPHAYWTLWSDLMIHRIHTRVLEHVRRHAEQAYDVKEDRPTRPLL